MKTPFTTAVVLFGATIASAQAPATVPGWTLTMQMSVDSGNGRPATPMVMKLTGSGTKLLQEMTLANVPPMSVIVDGDTKTMTTVMAQMGMAMTMNIPTINLEKAVTSNPQVKTMQLGAGEPFNGMPTSRIHVTGSTTITQGHGALTCTMTEPVDFEAVTVRDTVLANVVDEFTRFGAIMGAQTSDEFDPIRRLGIAAGTAAVRSVVHQNVGATPVTMTIEFREAKRMPVDAALFSAPAGMNVQDMRGMDIGAMAGAQMSEMQDRIFWARFDTTAAAGARRATCKPKS